MGGTRVGGSPVGGSPAGGSPAGGSPKRRELHARKTRGFIGGCVVLLALVLVGCGSSKPAFCSHVSELESSLKSLGGLTAQSGVSGLEAALAKVNSSAKAVVSSAKSEFPTQTAAIEKSVNALDTTVKELSSSTSTGARNAAIAKLPGEVSAVDKAFSEFSSATKSACK